MDLCLSQSILALSPITTTVHRSRLLPKPSLAFLHHRRPSRSVCLRKLVPRSSISEETPSGGNLYGGRERDVTVVVEDVPPVEKPGYGDRGPTETPKEEFPKVEPSAVEQEDDFFANILKFDFGDTYSLLLYGGGALLALWLASAIVGAIDSIPLFPKLMEVVGLGYSFWFTSRYLLFKKDRDELVAKVEELKQQVLGSSDD